MAGRPTAAGAGGECEEGPSGAGESEVVAAAGESEATGGE